MLTNLHNYTVGKGVQGHVIVEAAKKVYHTGIGPFIHHSEWAGHLTKEVKDGRIVRGIHQAAMGYVDCFG